MFENRYPLFSSGRLLKIEMLEELRDFPREFFNVEFKDYSNGVIAGCDIDVTDNFIIVSKGILKYEDTLYLLKEEKKIKYECNNKLMILKVKFLPLIEDKDFNKNSTEINLSEKLVLEDNEIELCRFKLRAGAKLRAKHIDFNDLCTEYDTVNIINAPYAAREESSLNPEILRSFGKELLGCSLNDPWDISFGITCIQSKEAIQKEIIISYLSNKLGVEMRTYNNEALYYYLLEILNNAKDGAKGNGRRSSVKGKKILID